MKILGLDIGSTSIGWAVVDTDNEDKENNKIIKCGVRLFDSVAQDRLGKLISEDWATSKSSRNRFKRKKERLNNIIKKFKDIGFLDSDFDKEIFFKNFHKNIYKLRSEAVLEKILKEEIFACIYYLAKHRGYRSGPVLKGGKKDGTKDNIIETKKKMEEIGEKTLGQLIYKTTNKDEQNPNYIRYRNRLEKVITMADKDMIENEAKVILESQSRFYNQLDSAFIEEIINIINTKAKSIDEKQIREMLGVCQFEKDETRTSSNTLTAIITRIVQKINNIKLIEKSTETSKETSKDYKYILTGLLELEEHKERKSLLIEKLLLEFFRTYKLSYSKIREIANIGLKYEFKDLKYRDDAIKQIYKIFSGYLPKSKKSKKDEEDKKDSIANNKDIFKNFSSCAMDLYNSLGCDINEFKKIIESYLKENRNIGNIEDIEDVYKKYQKLSKESLVKSSENDSYLFEDGQLKIITETLNLKFDSLDSILKQRDFVDSVVLKFFFNKDYMVLDEKLKEDIPDKQKRDKIINDLIEKIKGTSNLSIKALKTIEPFLLQGFQYTQACQNAGYDETIVTQRFKKLPLMREAMRQGLVGVNNPRVRKINNQTIKLINELINRKIYFDRIHIELARDLPKTKKEAEDIKKSNQNVEESKRQAQEALSDILGSNPTPKEITKARLFVLQNERCPYCDENLRREDLSSHQIDHIKPLSRSFDNTFSNKVLAHFQCNANKGNRLPLEWLEGDKAEQYKARIGSLFKNLGNTKIKNLLKTEIKDEDLENPRILTETRYASRFLKNYIEKHLDFDKFSPQDKGFQRVQTRNGGVTNILRNYWHIGEQDETNNSESVERYKKNRDFHTHHVEDAIIIAFSTQSLVQRIHTMASKITNKSNKDSNEAISYNTGEITTTPKDVSAKNQAVLKEMQIRDDNDKILKILHSSAPIDNMQIRIKEAISNIFPSRMVTRLKKYGAIHDDTIYSIRDKSSIDYKRISEDKVKEKIKNKDIENLVIIKKQSLNDKDKAKKNIEKMIGKDARNRKLYECIKSYLESNTNEQCMYCGIEVNNFKFEEKFNTNMIFIRGGVAKKSGQQKYLIYKKDEYYYVGVVYFGDNVVDDKTARVQISDSDKDYEYRDYSDDGYIYQMTLYKNDLIYYEQENKQHKDGFIKKIYYVDDFNPSKGNSQMYFLDPIDNKNSPSVKFGRLSRNNIKTLERLSIDMLGNVYRFQNGNKINFTKEALEIMRSQTKD